MGLAKVFDRVFRCFLFVVDQDTRGRVDGIRGCDDIPGWSGASPRLWS